MYKGTEFQRRKEARMTKGRTKAKMENTLVFYHAEEQVEGALARAEPEEDTGHT